MTKEYRDTVSASETPEFRDGASGSLTGGGCTSFGGMSPRAGSRCFGQTTPTTVDSRPGLGEQLFHDSQQLWRWRAAPVPGLARYQLARPAYFLC